MKKKIVAMMLASVMACGLWACGNSEKQDAKQDASNVSKKEEQKPEKDIPEGTFTETGSGAMYLNTAGGTSENGNLPVIYEPTDAVMDQIELDTTGFDGSMLSYIYIDGMLNSKEQLVDSQTSLTLEEDELKEGTHKVEVLQYENDEPSSSPVTYKTAQYEVKAE